VMGLSDRTTLTEMSPTSIAPTCPHCLAPSNVAVAKRQSRAPSGLTMIVGGGQAVFADVPDLCAKGGRAEVRMDPVAAGKDKLALRGKRWVNGGETCRSRPSLSGTF
jgi:hypothetical protein